MINIIVAPTNVFCGSKTVVALRENGIETRMTYGYNYDTRVLNVNYRTHHIPDPPMNLTVLNHPKAIRYCNDKTTFKLDMRRLLPEYMPKVYIPGRHFIKFPCILRSRYHLQGKNFEIAKSYQQMFELIKANPKLHHAFEIIYPNDEFRVWLGRSYDGEIKSLKLQKKEVPLDEVEEWIKNVIPKNYSRGNAVFKFAKKFKYKSNIRNAAKAVFEKTNLHFGAVDVLWNPVKEHPFVIEINPRFSVRSDSTLDCLTRYLKKYYKDFQEIL
jgi:hypothetical protein